MAAASRRPRPTVLCGDIYLYFSPMETINPIWDSTLLFE